MAHSYRSSYHKIDSPPLSTAENGPNSPSIAHLLRRGSKIGWAPNPFPIYIKKVIYINFLKCEILPGTKSISLSMLLFHNFVNKKGFIVGQIHRLKYKLRRATLIELAHYPIKSRKKLDCNPIKSMIKLDHDKTRDI